jgi:NarL family two-component system response regulator LiaR
MNAALIRVLVADDHDVVRWGLGAYLNNEPQVEIVGHARNGADAIQLCEAMAPNLVLMDVVMPGIDGIEATAVIRERYPHIRVIALSSIKDELTIRKMLQAGASGYLLKDDPIEDLIHAIKAAYSGTMVFSPEIAPLLLHPASTKAAYDLSTREMEVLGLMTQGLANREIAQRLTVSVSTVKFHVTNIIEKMEVQNRVDAVAVAMEKRLFDQA